MTLCSSKYRYKKCFKEKWDKKILWRKSLKKKMWQIIKNFWILPQKLGSGYKRLKRDIELWDAENFFSYFDEIKLILSIDLKYSIFISVIIFAFFFYYFIIFFLYIFIWLNLFLKTFRLSIEGTRRMICV